ncbi:MAG: SUMF1/EgtB/PvdO family nonheme iron enzyme [Akkermansiaceae bacterium]
MASEPDIGIRTGLQVGDYLVGELLARGTNTRLWQATQQSVQREVILCSVDSALTEDDELRQNFIGDVRTKASVDHPLIGSVLEAVDDGKHCFFALEKLKGRALGEIHDEGESMEPLHIVRILRNIAGALKHLEDQQTATLPITPHDIFIDERHHCRIANMAVSGEVDSTTSTKDKQLLGQLFLDMLEPDHPGSTRTGSLLGYMADFDREQPLTWDQIYRLSDEVERQLTEPSATTAIDSPTMKMTRVADRNFLGKLIMAIAVVGIIAGLAYYFVNRKPKPPERTLPNMVLIAQGKYPGPDGFPVKLREYWIDAHEVTIGEYAKFLDALEILSEDNRGVFQHDDQPADKASHQPDDWDALFSAAREGGQWNQLNVDLNCPVVGVDWWDAYAYAEWKGRRLPTREEWYAACSSSDEPGKIEPSGWSPVDESDKTKNNIYGLAGNVSEWMRKRSLNPADPTQPERYMICGASYLKPSYGVRAREWVDDRSLRRSDLGFRTLGTSNHDE